MSKKSKQTTTTNQTQTATATPTNPAWVDSGLEGMGGLLSGLAKADPRSFVAGPDPLQTQAANAASGLGHFGPQPGLPRLGAAAGFDPNHVPNGGQLSYAQAMGGGGQPQTSPVEGRSFASGVTDPYGAAMSTFDRMQSTGANTYDPVTGQAASYNPTTGTAAQFGGAKLGPAALTGDTQQVQAASLLDNLGAYMSPYTNDVVNSALADYDYGAGQNEAQAKLDLAGDSVFGGSGGMVGLAALREGQSRGRGTLSAGLRDQAFNTGANLSNLDAGRRQDASSQNAQSSLQRALADMQAKNTFGLAQGGFDQQAGLANQAATNQFGLANMDALNSAGQSNAGNQQQMNLANMGALNEGGRFNAGQQDTALARQMAGAQGLVATANDQQGQQRANIDTQSQLGQILQQLSQAQAGAPFSQASLLSSLWGSLPLDLLHGGTTNSVTNGTSTAKGSETGLGGEDAAKIATAAAMMFSDPRLKHSVQKVGQEPNGLGVYEFSYHGSNDRYVGYMADEVARVNPEAVVTTPSGYLAVNYGAL